MLSFFVDSRISKFILEPCNLQLEDETHSTRYHGHTAEHVLEKKSPVTVIMDYGYISFAKIIHTQPLEDKRE